MTVIRVPARTDVEAAGAFDHFKDRPHVGQVIPVTARSLEERIGLEVAAMKERDVARVDAAFHRLKPVALLQALVNECGAGTVANSYSGSGGWLLGGPM